MQTPQTDIRTDRPSCNERRVIAVICIAAAVRVFIFVAAFPFFNNIDEHFHFDMVFKYSRGHLPAAPLEKYDPNAAEIIVVNGTPEYYTNRPLEHPTPQEMRYIIATYAYQDDLETWSWPAYYMLAGLWCWIGKIIGVAGWHLLYWVRFLNVPIIAAFVWLSYLFARRFFAENFQQRIALPVMVAFFPQDIFFAITTDVLSPLAFAAAFFMLLEICLGEKSWRYHLLAGLTIAVTFLTKVSNIAIVLLAAGIVLIKIKQAASQKRLRRYLPCLAAVVAGAVIPVALWLGRNYVLFGDPVGANASMAARTWTKKPLIEMFHHPIFTPRGLIYFLVELTKTYWRGEFV